MIKTVQNAASTVSSKMISLTKAVYWQGRCVVKSSISQTQKVAQFALSKLNSYVPMIRSAANSMNMFLKRNIKPIGLGLGVCAIGAVAYQILLKKTATPCTSSEIVVGEAPASEETPVSSNDSPIVTVEEPANFGDDTFIDGQDNC